MWAPPFPHLGLVVLLAHSVTAVHGARLAQRPTGDGPTVAALRGDGFPVALRYSPTGASAVPDMELHIRRHSQVQPHREYRALLQDKGPSGAGKSHSRHHYNGDHEIREEPGEEPASEAMSRSRFMNEVRRRPGFSALAAFVTCVVACIFTKIVIFLLKYREVHAVVHRVRHSSDWTFQGYFYYRLSHWFVWTDHAPSFVTLGVFVAFVLAGAITYCTLLEERAGPALWKIFVWLVSPDGGAGEPTKRGAAVGALVSLGGLLIFAMVLTFLQDSFNNYLENLKMGRSPVMEIDHIVIVGYTGLTNKLVQDLCSAYESQGGKTIAILSEQPKPEVEEAIRAAGLELQGSQVVVRSGCRNDISALKHVGVDTCSTVILAPDHDLPNELADAFMMRVLLLLQGQGWPCREGQIVLVCRLTRNLEHFKRAAKQMYMEGGPRLQVVMLDRFTGQLMWQCSRGCGLGMAVQSLLGFRDSEFYIEEVPAHLWGKTIREASLYYPHAIVAGCSRPESDFQQGSQSPGSFIVGNMNRSPLQLLPETTWKLQQGDEVLLLAEEKCKAVASKKPCCQHSQFETLQAHAHAFQSRRKSVGDTHRPETVLILGWNERMLGSMLIEMEKSVPSGSQVLVFAPQPVEEREQAKPRMEQRCGRPFRNITLKHLEGKPECLYSLEHMQPPVEEATRIFVLRNQDDTSADLADTRTLFTLTHLRHILEQRRVTPRTERGETPRRMLSEPLDRASLLTPIVPELVDPKTGNLCQHQYFRDYVNASDLEASMLATVAVEPRVGEVLQAITTKGSDMKLTLRSLQDYLPCEEVPEEINFFDATFVVGMMGDLVVGWTIDIAGLSSVVVNPPNKEKVRPWCIEHDRLMVLARRKA